METTTDAFEQATQNFEKDFSEGKTQGDSSSKTDQAPDNEGASAIFDLDKAQKFRLDGQEWTPKDIRAAMLRQQDYTRKTQELARERQEYQKYQKFDDNLRFDLKSVRMNPGLAQKFKEIYPEKYHPLLDAILDQALNNTQQTQSNTQQAQLDPSFLNEFNEVKSQVKRFEAERIEQAVKSTEAKIDVVFQRNLGKYKLADEETVLARAQAYLNQSGAEDIDDATWDKIFKDVHDRNQSRYADYYKTEVSKQQHASSRARDSAAGGGTPGQAPKKLSFEEATKAAISDLSRKSI